MDIVSISHKGLRSYFVDGNAKGLKRELVPRIRTALFALQAAPDMESLEGPPG